MTSCVGKRATSASDQIAAHTQAEVHLLWDCPRWQTQRGAWLPLVQAEAVQLPALALPAAWPVYLRVTGLLPATLVRPEVVDQAGRLIYCLYGMYLAVLSARMGAEVAARRDAGAGPSVFAITRRCPPDARRGYPWGQLGAGPHPPAPPTAPLARRPVGGVLRDGARAVGEPTAVATRAGPRDVRGASPGLRGLCRAGTPGPQRPPAAGGHVAATHQGPSAKNGP